jgi:hypothetical protein
MIIDSVLNFIADYHTYDREDAHYTKKHPIDRQMREISHKTKQ